MNMKFKNKIRLDTFTDVQQFVNIASRLDGKIILTDGRHFSVNARSVLGALYSLEWEELYVESEYDIYTEIQKFII